MSELKSRDVSAELLDEMLAALRAQEKADAKREKCTDCEGEGSWWECGPCSDRYGMAIDLRRAAIDRAIRAKRTARVKAKSLQSRAPVTGGTGDE